MSKRVLIVDDEKDTRTYLASILKKKKYEVLFAEDGVEGLAKAREEKPDLIILDIMMPKKNGIRVLEALRRDPDLGDVNVIMLSGIRNFIEQAYKELDNVETIKQIEYLLDNPDSMSEVFFVRFQNFRKCLLLDRNALIEKYRKGQSGGISALPDIFLDKPIEPEEFSQAVARLIGRPKRENP
ncbi:MAG: response regulator [Nitrospirae bacterium]|nr:response regulator [Nitrospirota bacterium]